MVLQLKDDQISSYLFNVNGGENNVNGKRNWDEFNSLLDRSKERAA